MDQLTPAIEMHDVSLARQREAVISGVSLRIHAGETVTVVGPSGSGKTTVLRLILGLLTPDQGRIDIAGEVASTAGRILLPPERRGLAVVFQDLALWPHLTVEQNLGFGLDARGSSREERDRSVRAMLERVGLGDKALRLPGQLSGGERQRVAIARALVVRPRAVLLDEPLANLDPVLRADLLTLLRSLLLETGGTALYVTHDVREITALKARVIVLERGRIVAMGSGEELARAAATPFVRALFSSSAFA